MKIEGLIVKFLNKEADAQELDALDIWLRNEANVAVFNHFVKTEYLTTISMTDYDVNKAKAAIKQKLKENERKTRFLFYRKIAIAASIIMIFTAGFYKLLMHEKPLEVSDQVPVYIETGSNKAILTLGNGDEIALEKGKKHQIGKTKSNGEELVYSAEGQTNGSFSETAYHYLTIPRGGQFFVELADGTKVWLNSESRLKYPVQFQKGATRQVELEYGEAYFKVSPSTKHNGAEFHLLTKSQEISVLGTEFNIKAYNRENEIATTLVEGSVKVKKGANTSILKPNQQSIVHIGTDAFDVQEVDVSQEISWVKGLFTFNEESLEKIMTVLSRWYDVEVVFESEEQKKFVFTGIVERSESIDNILKLIEATSAGQVKFAIKHKTIHIN